MFFCIITSYIIYHVKYQVHDEIEHLMDDDGDMAEMYLTEKKQRLEANIRSNLYLETSFFGKQLPKSAPVSPVGSTNGSYKLQRAFSSIVNSSSLMSSSNNGDNVEQLEMLLEAYFVVIDDMLSKLLSVW